MSTHVIEHVSDTARWVAAYRARETDRPDALFRDPLARRLAGEQGESIVRALAGGESMEWTVVVRTVVFDEIIQHAVNEEGVDLVLNLAAGLDTRPYRLAVPSSLRWVEADFPGLIAHKERVLDGEKLRCVVERVAIDLSDVDARRAMLARVSTGARKIFVLTEGLVMYLEPAQVASLASDLADVPGIDAWSMDLFGPMIKVVLNIAWRRHLRSGDAAFHFAPDDPGRFFAPFGWEIRQQHAFDAEALRLGRMPGFSLPWYLLRPRIPKVALDVIDRWAGMLVLGRRPR